MRFWFQFLFLNLFELYTLFKKFLLEINSLYEKNGKNKQQISFSKTLARIVLILIFILVSEHKPERQKLVFLSWNMRLKEEIHVSKVEKGLLQDTFPNFTIFGACQKINSVFCEKRYKCFQMMNLVMSAGDYAAVHWIWLLCQKGENALWRDWGHNQFS